MWRDEDGERTAESVDWTGGPEQRIVLAEVAPDPALITPIDPGAFFTSGSTSTDDEVPADGADHRIGKAFHQQPETVGGEFLAYVG
jgi:hypothetical protein